MLNTNKRGKTMRQEIVNIYQFSELEEEAQEKAIEKFREHNLDYKWWDFTYDDAKEIAKLMGIEIDRIYFSGFWSQGDGACFVGRYYYQKDSVKNVKAYAPQDKQLHRIALELSKIQKRYFYQVYAQIKHDSPHYSHEYTVTIDVFGENQNCINPDDEKTVKDLLRDYMRWIYKNLETEYEYLQSDEVIRETIEANAYEFYADGSMV